MKIKFAGAGLCAVLAAAPIFAQQGGAGAGQGGAVPGGAQGVPGQDRKNFSAGMPGGSLGITQTPWFSDPGIRKQLNLNPNQFDQLNKNYGQAYGQFRNGYEQLGKLTEQQRLQRLQELTGGFHNSFGQDSRQALNAEQRQRFRQLYLQYQGPAALADPTVQEQLRLSEEQRQKLNQGGYFGLSDAAKGFSEDPAAASQRFDALRQQQQQWMSNFLTPEQMTQWRQITGNPYNFQPGLTPGTGTNPGTGLPPGTGTNPGTGLPPGTGTNPGTGLPPGTGTNPGTGLPPGTGTVPRTGPAPGTGTIPGTGTTPRTPPPGATPKQ